MREIIILKNGDEIETIEELEEYFGESVEKYKYDYYEEILSKGCFCQIKMQEFMSDKEGYEFDGVNWWEKQ